MTEYDYEDLPLDQLFEEYKLQAKRCSDPPREIDLFNEIRLRVEHMCHNKDSQLVYNEIPVDILRRLWEENTEFLQKNIEDFERARRTMDGFRKNGRICASKRNALSRALIRIDGKEPKQSWHRHFFPTKVSLPTFISFDAAVSDPAAVPNEEKAPEQSANIKNESVKNANTGDNGGPGVGRKKGRSQKRRKRRRTRTKQQMVPCGTGEVKGLHAHPTYYGGETRDGGNRGGSRQKVRSKNSGHLVRENSPTELKQKSSSSPPTVASCQNHVTYGCQSSLFYQKPAAWRGGADKCHFGLKCQRKKCPYWHPEGFQTKRRRSRGEALRRKPRRDRRAGQHWKKKGPYLDMVPGNGKVQPPEVINPAAGTNIKNRPTKSRIGKPPTRRKTPTQHFGLKANVDRRVRSLEEPCVWSDTAKFRHLDVIAQFVQSLLRCNGNSLGSVKSQHKRRPYHNIGRGAETNLSPSNLSSKSVKG